MEIDHIVSHAQPTYNLLDEPWIPVVTANGVEELGLHAVLSRAHEISDIAVYAPIPRYALMRYLVALTYVLHYHDKSYAWDKVVLGDEPLPPEAINCLMDRLGPHMWLYHPDTPFMQTPCVFSKGSVAHRDNSMLPQVPSDGNAVWWSGTDIHMTKPMLALALLTRHFAAVPSVQSGVAMLVEAKETSRSNSYGGLFMSSTKDMTHVFWRRSSSLAATLASNLSRSVSDKMREDSQFFWECTPERPRLDDPLFLYTASSAAAYLADDGRAILTAYPYASKDLRKTVINAARFADPHTMKAPKPGVLAQKMDDVSYVSFSITASQYENLYNIYRKVNCPQDLRPCVLQPIHHVVDGAAQGGTLEVYCAKVGGTPTGAKVYDAAVIEVAPDAYCMSPFSHQLFRSALNKLADVKNSVLSNLLYSQATALGLGRNTPPYNRMKAKTEAQLWEMMADTVDGIYEHALQASDDDPMVAPIPAGYKDIWVQRACDIFATNMEQHVMDPNIMKAFVLENKRLKRKLYAIL